MTAKTEIPSYHTYICNVYEYLFAHFSFYIVLLPNFNLEY